MSDNSEITVRCKQCGREFTANKFSGDKFCCDPCKNKYLFEQIKPKGMKTLKKWKKGIEHLQHDIDRLEGALASENATDVSIAITGGVAGSLKKLAKFIFMIPCYIFWPLIIIAIIMYINQKNPNGQNVPVSSPQHEVSEMAYPTNTIETM